MNAISPLLAFLPHYKLFTPISYLKVFLFEDTLDIATNLKSFSDSQKFSEKKNYSSLATHSLSVWLIVNPILLLHSSKVILGVDLCFRSRPCLV